MGCVACQQQSASFIGRALSLVVALTITLIGLSLLVCLFQNNQLFLVNLLYKVLPRVFAYAEPRIRFKSLHLTRGLTLPVQRAHRYFNTALKTSFYKILHKIWIATPLTCQYLIQKIPQPNATSLYKRSGFYLCRIFNEGAWSL